MFEQDFRIIHGWVDDILKDPTNRDTYRLQVREEEGALLDLAMAPPSSPIKLGDEVSVAVARLRPGRVLALVDHTTGEGTNYLRDDDQCSPSEVDILIIAAVIGLSAVAVGWMAMLALGVLASAHWLIVRRLPEVRRNNVAAHIDYLLDKEYCRWRTGLSRKRGV